MTVEQTRTKFYVAKVQHNAPPRDLLYPITLYAADDASAETSVRAMREVADDDEVTVRAVRIMHQDFFGRTASDQRGCVQHFEIVWSQPGPFTPIDLFEG